MQTESLKGCFEEQGYVFLSQVIDLEFLSQFETHLAACAAHSLAENGEHMHRKPPPEILRRLNHVDPKAFYQVCRGAGTSVAGLSVILNSKLADSVAEVSGRDVNALYPTTPAVFWNDPDSPRLQYDWHQEAAYYPDRKTSFHVWFPLFRDLEVVDGPMVVCSGSHKELYEYERIPVKNGLTQLRVSDSIADQFAQIPCELNRGDAILFHPNLIHKTLDNHSSIPRTSGIIRFFALMDEPQYAPILGSIAKA